MCRAVRCKTCQKATWAGCGLHVAQVKARVPEENWCNGHATTDGAPRTSWLRRLLGARDSQ